MVGRLTPSNHKKKINMAYQRALTTEFFGDLKSKSGLLAPLLQRVKNDDTLMLALRGSYVNIYYRGGNLLKVSAMLAGGYSATFDANYNQAGHVLPDFPFMIGEALDAQKLADSISALKYTMDHYLTVHPKSEREFQQLVARENNCSPISNETEYFIVDIEAAGISEKARFDMLGVRWLRNERKKQDCLVPVLIEMKYGKDALGGESGLKKHLDDAHRISEDSWKNLCMELEEQVNQLADLGLLQFTRSSSVQRLTVDKHAKKELIFLLANYNPASTKVFGFLDTLQELPEDDKGRYDLLFFAASFAGYGLHRACMLDLASFKDIAKKLHAVATA